MAANERPKPTDRIRLVTGRLQRRRTKGAREQERRLTVPWPRRVGVSSGAGPRAATGDRAVCSGPVPSPARTRDPAGGWGPGSQAPCCEPLVCLFLLDAPAARASAASSVSWPGSGRGGGRVAGAGAEPPLPPLRPMAAAGASACQGPSRGVAAPPMVPGRAFPRSLLPWSRMGGRLRRRRQNGLPLRRGVLDQGAYGLTANTGCGRDRKCVRWANHCGCVAPQPHHPCPGQGDQAQEALALACADGQKHIR